MIRFPSFLALAILAVLPPLGTSCQLGSRHGQVAIAVRLNEYNRVIMASDLGDVVLDTGSPISLMDADLALDQHLKKLSDTVLVKDASGAMIQAETALIERLSIPAKKGSVRWEMENIEVALIKGFRSQISVQGAPLILGAPVLKGRIVELDLAASEVRLLSRLPSGVNSQEVELQIVKTGRAGVPGIKVLVDGNLSFEGILDTGYGGHFALSNAAWEQVGALELPLRDEAGGGFIKQGAIQKGISTKSISVGNVTLRDAPVSRIAGAGLPRNLIGISLLKRTSVAIDWDEEVAVFSTPKTEDSHLWMKMSD